MNSNENGKSKEFRRSYIFLGVILENFLGKGLSLWLFYFIVRKRIKKSFYLNI